jgi:hypothetical protein
MRFGYRRQVSQLVSEDALPSVAAPARSRRGVRESEIDRKAKLSLPVTCRSKPGEAAVHWPIRYSTSQDLCPVQPTAGKACSLQSAHQSGHSAGGGPDDPRFVIRDHA